MLLGAAAGAEEEAPVLVRVPDGRRVGAAPAVHRRQDGHVRLLQELLPFGFTHGSTLRSACGASPGSRPASGTLRAFRRLPGGALAPLLHRPPPRLLPSLL